jgi:hypothetical protein
VIAELVDSNAHPGFYDRVPTEKRHDVMAARQMAEDQARERVSVKRRYVESCERALAHLEADRSKIPTLSARTVSNTCGHEYPIGLADDGSYAVVQVETKETYFTLSVPSRVRAIPSPERIEVVPLDGGERRTLATASDFFGLGAYLNGRVYAVQAFWERFGLIEIDVASGERRVLHLVDRPDQIRGPLPSPDGAWVLVWLENEGSERERPMLIRTDGGDPDVLERSITSFNWVELELPEDQRENVGPQLLIAVTTHRERQRGNLEDSELPQDTLELIDPDTRSVVARLVDEQIESLKEVVGVASGSVLFLHRARLQPRCSLGTWRPWSSENALDLTPLSQCVSFPHMLSGDDVIARSVITTADDPLGSDDEIVRLNSTTGAITQLTVNAVDDRYIHAGSSTRRIVFGRVLPTYDRDLPRVAVMVAELGE